MNYCLITLGCPKNEVDAECMQSILNEAGFVFSEDPREAKFLILNTCGFIDAALSEAIDYILDLIEIKKASHHNPFLIITGCAAQRYRAELYENFPEIDQVLGTKEYYLIARSLKKLIKQEESLEQNLPPQQNPAICHLNVKRARVKDRYFAYLKVAEGCSHSCSYCAIPGIRGRQVSLPFDQIIQEAKRLVELGYLELVIVAQDTTRYGLDLRPKRNIVELLEELENIPGLKRLRILYTYADAISPEFIAHMAKSKHLVPYLDMPIQHASDSILKAMRRRDTNASLASLITELRAKIRRLSLRTTVMVGFPGETEEDFNILLDFLKKHEFDRLGCFIFSPQVGTKAYELEPKVDKEVARDRYNQLMTLQNEIMARKSKAKLGQTVEVLIESVSDLYYLGRSEAEAYDIDPSIYVLSQKEEIKLGSFEKVKLIDYNDCDFVGVSVDEFTE